MRFPCREDPVGLGSSQLQIFQEFLRVADELHVAARRKPKCDSDFLYERHAILRIKTVRWLRIFPPTVHDSKHSPILFVTDWERKMRLAHRDVIVWHRDDITFNRIPKYGRRDRLSREAEIGLDWFSVPSGRSTQRDIGVGECDAQSIGAKMVRIEGQRDFGTGTRGQGKEKSRRPPVIDALEQSPRAAFDWRTNMAWTLAQRTETKPGCRLNKYRYLKTAWAVWPFCTSHKLRNGDNIVLHTLSHWGTP